MNDRREVRLVRTRSRWLAIVVIVAGTLAVTTGCGSRLSDRTLAAAGGGGTATVAGQSGTAGAVSGDGTGAASTDQGAAATDPGAAAAAGGTSTDPGAAAAAGGTSTVPGAAAAAGGTSTVPGAAAGGGTSTVPGAAAAGGAVQSGKGATATSTSAAKPGAAGQASAKPGAAGKASAAPGTAAAGPVSSATLFNSAIFGGTAPCTPATGSPIPLGNVSTLSGVLGLLFAPVKPALQVFVKSQNACGGLNNHPIQLTVEDDQDDPSTAVSDGQAEVQNNHILAFVGNIQVLTIDAMRKGVIDPDNIPIIGGDITNDTWFEDPLLFPQGAPPEGISYGFLNAMVNVQKQTDVGDMYCLEVPQACSQIDKGFNALAAQVGASAKYTVQVSITSPSYTSQCLAAQSAGVKAMALIVDAPTMGRWVKSCSSVGFNPVYDAYPLGVGNESEFLNVPGLGNTIVPLQTFPWMSSVTPAEKYYQAAVAKYDPGFTTGDAASDGWVSGAVLVAGSKYLSATNPTTAQLLQGLDEIKGGAGSDMGGLTAPLTYGAGVNPTVPYCLFSVTSNAANTGWGPTVDKCVSTSIVAPGAPA